MDPIFTPYLLASAFGSITNAMASVWNGWQSRKQAIILEDKRATEKRINDQLAFERLINLEEKKLSNELQKLKQTLENNKDLENLKFLNELEKQLRLKNYDKLLIPFKPGELLDTILPNERRPIVIFDTNIYHNTTKKDELFIFNPMDSLYHSFKSQTDIYLRDEVAITNFPIRMESNGQYQALFNIELYNKPAIIIYGIFDGNYLRINAVYGGMTIDQYSFDYQCQPQIVSKVNSLCLAEIPLSLLSQKIDSEKSTSDKLLIREKFQKLLLDLISNSSIQALIDCHFSIQKSFYLPIVGKTNSVNDIMKIEPSVGIEKTDEFKQAIESHGKMLLTQLDALQSMRMKYFKEYLKNTNL